MNKPSKYGTPHPKIPYKAECHACAIGIGDKKAVAPTAPEDLSKVKLIVISDHAGSYEEKNGYLMYSNEPLRENKGNKILPYRNAGNLLRYVVSKYLELDHYEEVYYTNAIRCNPRKDIIPTDSHAKKCATLWLRSELIVLKEEAPQACILIAGHKAYKAVDHLYRLPYSSLKEARRRLGSIDGRPTAFTVNPAAASTCWPRFESRVYKGKIQDVVELPALPGFPFWHFVSDIIILKEYLKED